MKFLIYKCKLNFIYKSEFDKEVIELKKATLITTGACVLLAGVGISMILFLPKQKIVLKLEDNKLTWEDNTGVSLVDCQYEIYNDDFKVASVTDNSYFITSQKLIDEVGPGKVKNVVIDYSENEIGFRWDDIEDKGTPNNLWVGLFNNNGRQYSYSNVVKVNYASGIYRYVVSIDDEKYEPISNEFRFNRVEMKEGITRVKLYAVDKRRNIGEIVEIPLYNFKVNLSDEDGNLKYGVEDNTQTYKFKAYINNEDIGIIDNSVTLNERLTDREAPDAVTNVVKLIDDKKVLLKWAAASDVGTKYSVRVDGVGNTYKNSVYSDEIDVIRESGIKGYYYVINDTPNYNVTENDKFIDTLELNEELEYGKYYFHIASVDNNGNISSTTTCELNVKEPEIIIEDIFSDDEEDDIPDNNINSGNVNIKPITPIVPEENNGQQEEIAPPINEKEQMIVNMIERRGTVSEQINKTAIEYMDKLSKKTISMLDGLGLKIYITSGNANELLNQLTGKSADGSSGYYCDSKKRIVVLESSVVKEKLLHEVGHIIDYGLGNNKYLSSGVYFGGIYNDEKDKLFSSESKYKNNPNEYFAEAISLYYLNKNGLDSLAPRTAAYLKNLL